MAYTTGTGANAQDFLDAVRTFAAGLGWTINRWDTAAKRLYLSKGLCRMCLEWHTSLLSNYFVGNVNTPNFPEGVIRGSLVGTIGAADDFCTFAGSVSTSLNLGPLIYMGNMQGPFVQWFLFSNATGDYIHAIVQTTADTYTFLGFGNADKGGLTHSGAAYAFSEGGRSWFRTATQASQGTTSVQQIFNKPGRTSTFGADGLDRFATGQKQASLHLYTENALPVSGWVNSVTMSTGAPSTVTSPRTTQTVMPLKTLGNEFDIQTSYPSPHPVGCKLLDPVITMAAPDYTSFVPMLGVPLIACNTGASLACAVGMIPDIRVINLTGLAPQQELALGVDTWKVFPQFRQTAWADGRVNEAPSSGHFGLALRKI